MRIEQVETVVAKSVMIESSFSIKQENAAFIINILRSKLYSNKVLAVIREYAANAWDANNDTGYPDRPIDVTVPTIFDPTLKIRDYGYGLTEEQIREVYASYGASTKRDSNDDIGGMGIGSKSAFAYTNSFFITSIYKTPNGNKKDVYNAYIDESNVGKVALMMSENTRDYTGIEIKVAVDVGDVVAFQTQIENNFQYWKIKPNFHGKQINFVEEQKLIEGNNWYIAKEVNNNTSFVIMGQIAYPLNFDLIFNEDEIKKRSRLPYRIILPIGAVDIAATREELEYNSRTINVLKEIFETIRKEFQQRQQEKLDTCTSMAEAIITLNQMQKVFMGGVKPYFWKDQALGKILAPANKLYLPAIIPKRILYCTNYRNKLKIMDIDDHKDAVIGSLGWDFDYYKHNIYLMLKDDKGTNIQLKIKQKLNELGENACILLITSHDNIATEKYIETNKVLYEGYNFIKSSEIILPPREKKVKDADEIKIERKNHKVNCLVFDKDKIGIYNRVKSDYWKESEIPDDLNVQNVYLTLNRFQWERPSDKVKVPIDNIVELFKQLKINNFDLPTIYGIKVDTEIPENCIEFEEYFKNVIQKELENRKIIYKTKGYNSVSYIYSDFIKQWIDEVKIKPLIDNNSLFNKVVESIYEYYSYKKEVENAVSLFLSMKTIVNIGIDVNDNLEKDKDIHHLLAEVDKKYVLMEWIKPFQRWFSKRNDIEMKALIDYINFIDQIK